MKSTFNVLYYLKRNAIRKEGRMPIVTRVTVDGIIVGRAFFIVPK